MKKYGQPLAVILLTACMLMTGCESTREDKLLMPPSQDEEHTELLTALYDSTGSEISPEYPMSGGGSAFMLSDLDGSGEMEAVVFYRPSSRSSGAASLRMNILSKNGGSWRSVCDIQAEGDHLDRVTAEMLGDSSRQCLIAGSRMKGGREKQFTVYDYDGDKLNVLFENEPYSLFDTQDLDGDGKKELITVSAGSQAKVSSAVVYRPDKDGAFQSSSLPLNEIYTDYTGMTYSSKEGRNTRYIYLDALLASGNVMTEVLRYGADHTLDRAFAPDREASETMRSRSCPAKDINNDGLAEIPVPHLCPGYDKDSDDPVYFTWWQNADEGTLKTVCDSYFDEENGYAFIIPDDWAGKVTAGRQGADSVTVAQGSSPAEAKEIFTIKTAYGREMCSAAEADGFEAVLSRGNMYILAKISGDSPVPCTPQDIGKNLHFIY